MDKFTLFLKRNKIYIMVGLGLLTLIFLLLCDDGSGDTLILLIPICVIVVLWAALKGTPKTKDHIAEIIRCPTCGDKAYLYEDGSWECTFCGDFGRMK